MIPHPYPSRALALAAAIGLGVALLGTPGLHASPIYKCVSDGKITYQQDPCPAAGLPLPRPTAAELNAARKAASPSGPSSSATATSASRPGAPGAAPSAAAPPSPALAALGPASARFRCDGRSRCSQMRSCEEATYFLQNCPNVDLDGDGDGIPCEQQWCGQGAGHTGSFTGGAKRRH